MPKVTESQVGQVFIKEKRPHKWCASWTCPITRKHVRRILPASDFKTAESLAKEINVTLAQGKGFGGRLRGAVGHTITNAIKEAVLHSGGNLRTRADYLSRANAFTEYLGSHAAGIVSWADVNEEVLTNYIQHCRRADISHDTLRMRIYVLRLTSDFMSRTYPQRYRHIAGRLRLPRTDKHSTQSSDAVILTPSQIRTLLALLAEKAPLVHIWASLQGLCGLRLYEAIYLREQDIDVRAGTLTVAKSAVHTPKNDPSHRTIPVPKYVSDLLQRWIRGMTIRHGEGFLFLPERAPHGRAGAKTAYARAGVITPDYASHLWRKALKIIRDTTDDAGKPKIKLPEGFIPRKLRSSFATAMREARADFECLQKYLGHRPGSVLSAHYDHISLDRLREIAALGDDLVSGRRAFAEAENADVKNACKMQ